MHINFYFICILHCITLIRIYFLFKVNIFNTLIQPVYFWYTLGIRIKIARIIKYGNLRDRKGP